MFYVSIIFQKNMQVYQYSSILINLKIFSNILLSFGGGGAKKNLDILGGDPEKKWKF